MQQRANSGVNQQMLSNKIADENEDNQYLQVYKDDLNDSDIMAYSSINAASDEGEDETTSFESGGAIMDALAQSDPDKFKSKPPKKAAKSKGKSKAPAKKAVRKFKSDIKNDEIPGDEISQDPQQHQKDNFLDGVVESTLTNKSSTTFGGKKRKLNSYEL